MIALVQRVSRAEVRTAGREPARIGRGLLILLGAARGDSVADAEWLARKCLSLRVFDDEDGRMNCSLADVGGEVLAVSQFTLLGDCIKGRRPSWSRAAEPGEAEELYDAFVGALRRGPQRVATGRFQARMEVDAINAGPVTLIIDSHAWKGRPVNGTRPAAAPRACDSQASAPARQVVGGPPTGSSRDAVTAGRRLLRRGTRPLRLASRSPRRRHLLQMLGVRFTVVAPVEDGEGRRVGEAPEAYAMRQAETKARSAWKPGETGVLLGADTIVYLDGVVLEKPRHAADAAAYLERLSGRVHEVYTGLCLLDGARGVARCAVERSRVTMTPLDAETIADYVATGEPLDKAGAYGIQGFGALLVAAIEGCYFNVMGLPLARLRALFAALEEAAPPGESEER